MYPFASPMMMGGSAAAGGPTTWNPNDKGLGAILSNNNLTVTGPSNGADNLTRATNGKSSGKWSFRITSARNDRTIAGLANLTEANNRYLGQTANSIGLYHSNSGVVSVTTSSQQSDFSTSPSNANLDVIVDLDVRKVWFILGGTSIFNGGSPSVGTGGFPCPAGAVFPCAEAYDATYALTLDIATSRFSGFPAWG